ncbi:MAG TPA: hypothetical protein VJ843_03210 [Candidatus Saccharimonadales bacterium]|nr:hypothetical protein [Candidatus Saccharimonadales bacterium]
MSISLRELSNRRDVYYWLYIVGSLLFIFAALLWWNKASVDPASVFWGTVRNGMTTTGVTLHINEGSSSAKDSQAVQYSLGVSNKVHSTRTVVQNGTTVKTESVGDATHTYTRYTGIQTNQKTTAGKKADFSKVLNVWAVPASDTSSAQLLPQVALGLALPLGAVPMPIGYITPVQRESIVHDMQTRSLYQVSFANKAVKKETKNGRLLYTYSVTMQPELYVTIMKEFAKNVGMKDLENVDAAQYASTASVTVSLTIDAHAKQLVKVENSSQGYSESYSGYGVPVTTQLPTNALSYTELQKRLQALQ